MGEKFINFQLQKRKKIFNKKKSKMLNKRFLQSKKKDKNQKKAVKDCKSS